MKSWRLNCPVTRPSIAAIVAESRTDPVHAHAAVDPLDCEHARQVQHRALRRVVRARVRIADEAADRRDVDDAALPLCEHLAPERLTRQIRALEVERDDPVEL